MLTPATISTPSRVTRPPRWSASRSTCRRRSWRPRPRPSTPRRPSTCSRMRTTSVRCETSRPAECADSGSPS
ncbi:hypothetical protein ACFPRL_26880 [Pseudoclavibacter helvolus]